MTDMPYIITTLIQTASFVAVLVFSTISTHRGGTQDIEKRIEEAKHQAASDTRIESKLNEIVGDTKDIKAKVELTAEKIERVDKRVTLVEASVDRAHERIDEIAKGDDK